MGTWTSTANFAVWTYLAARGAARALHVLYFLNSKRRGDIVIVRATAA